MIGGLDTSGDVQASVFLRRFNSVLLHDGFIDGPTTRIPGRQFLNFAQFLNHEVLSLF